MTEASWEKVHGCKVKSERKCPVLPADDRHGISVWQPSGASGKIQKKRLKFGISPWRKFENENLLAEDFPLFLCLTDHLQEFALSLILNHKLFTYTLPSYQLEFFK